LKICAAHGSGYLPSYAPRSDHRLRVAPDMDTGGGDGSRNNRPSTSARCIRFSR
jgi:hypothetical protein